MEITGNFLKLILSRLELDQRNAVENGAKIEVVPLFSTQTKFSLWKQGERYFREILRE